MAKSKTLLDENWRYGDSPRVNDPAEYVTFLKGEPRFKGCSLDALPKHAIILHDAEAPEHIVRLGYTVEEFRFIETGTTDPNVMWLLFKKNGHPDFLLNRGLPGAGGIATQAAELGALGVQNFVHIGTCGLVGEQVRSGDLVLSRGSFKDAGAVMLSSGNSDSVDPVAHPSSEFVAVIEKQLSQFGFPHSFAIGYTIPIFYFQPAQLIIELITGEAFPGGPSIGYFEMEEASFFQTCRLMGTRATSMVVGSDRYILKDGTLTHNFEDDVDQDAAKLKMLQTAIAAFDLITE
jgi:uridine phosphorylase